MGTTDFLKLKTITGSTPVNVNTGMGTNFERIDEWASTTETKISDDAAALEAFKGSVIDGADEIWATTQDGIPAGAHGVSRLVTSIRTTISQKVAELTEKITANTTKADANAASIEMLNSNWGIGGIIESGENYVRFNDGTQICYQTAENIYNFTTAYGSMFHAGERKFYAFSKPFSSKPFATVSTYNTGIVFTGSISADETRVGFYLCMPSSSSNVKTNITILAVGRWK